MCFALVGARTALRAFTARPTIGPTIGPTIRATVGTTVGTTVPAAGPFMATAAVGAIWAIRSRRVFLTILAVGSIQALDALQPFCKTFG